MGYPQPGVPQPGVPRQGYPQAGFGQPGFAQSPGPRKSRTGLIIGIVVAAVVVLGGGGITALMLSRNSGQGDQTVGRYTKQPDCTKLGAPPYKFTTVLPSKEDTVMQALNESCQDAVGEAQTVVATVALQTYLGPGGPGVAQRDMDGAGQLVSGNGFENPVAVQYQSDANGQRCVFRYNRSNEIVDIVFVSMTGVHDRAGCLSAGLPLVKQLYSQIG